jgi:NAD(P)-dependent dehydrogenase (short-subunit alcohol dehydrogenase family)
MHRDGTSSLRDINWRERRWNASQAYSDSKLYVTALAFAVARHWPDVLSNAVDPGWVPTRMGGPDAPDDLANRGISLKLGWRRAAIPTRQSAADIGITADSRRRPMRRPMLFSRTSSWPSFRN